MNKPNKVTSLGGCTSVKIAMELEIQKLKQGKQRNPKSNFLARTVRRSRVAKRGDSCTCRSASTDFRTCPFLLIVGSALADRGCKANRISRTTGRRYSPPAHSLPQSLRLCIADGRHETTTGKIIVRDLRSHFTYK